MTRIYLLAVSFVLLLAGLMVMAFLAATALAATA